MMAAPFDSFVRAVAGNFEHLMAYLRDLNRKHNAMVDDLEAIQGEIETIHSWSADDLEAAPAEDLTAHTGDTSDAHDASAISIADAANDFTATDVEGALAELQSDAESEATTRANADSAEATARANADAAEATARSNADAAHLGDTSDAHDASAISADSSTLVGTGTDVQAVLEELDNAIASATHDPVTVGTGLDVTNQLVELDLSEVAAGGELGGTLDAPTVDATHSGSAHHVAATEGAGIDITGQQISVDLSEIAAGGELGGNMDAPTVDATHSGSAHADFIAKALIDAAGDYIRGSAADTAVRQAASAAVPTTTGTAAAGTAGNPPSADDHVHALETHGAAKHTDITRTLWIPMASAPLDTATEGQSGTLPDRYSRYNLADAATTGFALNFLVPSDWSTGALVFKWYLAGSTSFGATDTVRIQTGFLEVADSTQLNAAGTNTTTNVDPGTGYVSNDLFIWTDPGGITPTVANAYVRAFISRVGGNAADDYTGVLCVVGLRVDYTANQ